jgi:hypothetical protein
LPLETPRAASLAGGARAPCRALVELLRPARLRRQCKGPDCIFCISPKTNLCPKIRGTQGNGQMPDGTSRFTLKSDGSTIHHFMGCSTFAE